MSSRDGRRKVQRLAPESLVECECCRELVVFRLVRTVKVAAEPNRVYAYLECPSCGARATQMRWRRSGKGDGQ
jgi:hypothetical protein